MKTMNYQIEDAKGLHIRPAMKLADIASARDCGVMVAANGKETSAGSMLGLLSLKVSCGQQIRLTVTGPDEATEQECLQELMLFLKENIQGETIDCQQV